MKKEITQVCLGALLLSACGSSGSEESTLEVIQDSILETESTAEVQEEEAEGPTQLVYEAVNYLAYGINRSFADNETISVDEMYGQALEGSEAELTVTGECVEICQMAGCWIEVARSNGEKVFVKFKDHFTLPIESTTGRKVLFHGVGKVDTTSVEMQRHYLDDRTESGESVAQEEYDAITEPKIGVSFLADGILVEEPKSH
jgi:hypothetical protein